MGGLEEEVLVGRRVSATGSALAAENFSVGSAVRPCTFAEWTIRNDGDHRKIHGASSQTMRCGLGVLVLALLIVRFARGFRHQQLDLRVPVVARRQPGGRPLRAHELRHLLRRVQQRR